jgi:hypothetical protein
MIAQVSMAHRNYFKDEANIQADWGESDPKQADQLATLKEELRRLHTISTFTTPHDLAAKVTADLHRWLFDEYLASQLEKVARGDIPREDAQALLTAIKDLSALSQNLLARLREAGYVKAQGERSIAIGGDVSGSTVMTGDQYIVHIGGNHPRTLFPEERQRKLAEYRQRVVSMTCLSVICKSWPRTHWTSGLRPASWTYGIFKVRITSLSVT